MTILRDQMSNICRKITILIEQTSKTRRNITILRDQMSNIRRKITILIEHTSKTRRKITILRDQMSNICRKIMILIEQTSNTRRKITILPSPPPLPLLRFKINSQYFFIWGTPLGSLIYFISDLS